MKEKTIHLKTNATEVTSTFVYEGVVFSWAILHGTIGFPYAKARDMALNTANSSLNMLELLGLEEYQRQQDAGILGMIGSYDEKKLTHKQFPIVHV